VAPEEDDRARDESTERRATARRWDWEVDMERKDWLDAGFDEAEARFLMVTAITHHRVSSPLWSADEVRKLGAELAEIDRIMRPVELAAQEAASTPSPPQRRRRLSFRDQEEPWQGLM